MSVSYAAVPAKISPRFAFVVNPTHKANAIVKAHIMPTFADQLETYEKPTMAPMSRAAASAILIRPTATVIDFSL